MTKKDAAPSVAGRLTGRRVLMTGAASGIGLATARKFAQAGATLALFDRNAAGLQAIAGELGVFSATVDLVDESAIRDAVAAAARSLGGLDGVVNVAGLGGIGDPLGDMKLADWNYVLAVNLTAPFLVSREALPHLTQAGGGTIVNVASASGLAPTAPCMGAYCASKGGVVMFSKAMAMELAPSIRVNVVCPGAVDTPLLVDAFRTAVKSASSPYALKRLAEADEIANVILFLTSAESSFVTGTAFAVDGGRTYH